MPYLHQGASGATTSGTSTRTAKGPTSAAPVVDAQASMVPIAVPKPKRDALRATGEVYPSSHTNWAQKSVGPERSRALGAPNPNLDPTSHNMKTNKANVI